MFQIEFTRKKLTINKRFWIFACGILWFQSLNEIMLTNCNARWRETMSSKKHPESSAVDSNVDCCSFLWLYDFLVVRIEFYCIEMFLFCVFVSWNRLNFYFNNSNFVCCGFIYEYSMISIWGVTVLLIFPFLSILLPHTKRFSIFQPFCTRVN